MTSIIRRIITVVALVIIVVTTTGCAESAIPQATGKGNIRGLHAVVTAPEMIFTIEERSLAEVDYREITVFTPYDDLSYNLNFDYLPPAALNPTRLATQFLDVQADHEYTVILTGSVAAPSTMVWDDPVREWSGTETTFEIFFAHLGQQVGELDVYFAAPGILPVLGQAVGSLAFGERLPPQEYEETANGYEVYLTAKDDPATIVFRSGRLAPLAQSRNTLAIFDPDPTVPGNVSVNIYGNSGTAAIVADVNFPSQLRTLHAAFGTENYDGYFDSDFANAIFSDIGFLELSPYADFPGAQALFTLTPVGNSGVTLFESDVLVAFGSRRTVVLTGQPGALGFFSLPDNGRPVETSPLVRISNLSFNTDILDVYVAEPGTPIDDVILPRFPLLLTASTSNFQSVSAGTQELTVTLRGEKTPIAAPVVLDLANGDVVDLVIVDTVDPAVVELLVFDP